jgi:hypothetical protein
MEQGPLESRQVLVEGSRPGSNHSKLRGGRVVVWRRDGRDPG